MTLDDLIDFTRTLLRDTEKPPLWSDDDLLNYLNEAKDAFVEETHLRVRSDETLELYSGEATYTLASSIAHLYRVRLDGINGNLGASTDAWTPVDSCVGTPSRYTTDTDEGAIRFWPTPDKEYTATLRVLKVPDDLSLDTSSETIDLQRDVLYALADWAAYRCFTHNDADGLNADAADRAKKRYDEAVRAKKRSLYRFKVGSATRVGGNRIG